MKRLLKMMVERVVDRVVAADPAAVLLGGDFLHSTDPAVSVQVETVVELLSPLSETPIPVFAAFNAPPQLVFFELMPG